MISARSGVIITALVLGACTTAAEPALHGERTVFHNPFVPPAIDQRGIGPQCDVDIGQDATCLGGPIIYPGRGRHISLGNGETARLTRGQARLLREREELLEALRDQPPPPPPPAAPPVAPTASKGETP
jgi:hypothetical protein